MKWILASGSPRRQQLLCQITEDFSVLPSQIEERRDPSWTAQELPRQLAAQKALDVSSRNPAALVIGADTIVSLDGTVLGKPRDEADAADMLRSLSGRTHQVYTGVTLLVKEQGIWKPYTFSERTDVEFYPVSREELLEYIKTGEPMDKAGSYGIQGKFGIYVKGIRGDYNNVVGLPVGRLVYELKKMKINIRGMRK